MGTELRRLLERPTRQRHLDCRPTEQIFTVMELLFGILVVLAGQRSTSGRSNSFN